VLIVWNFTIYYSLYYSLYSIPTTVLICPELSSQKWTWIFPGLTPSNKSANNRDPLFRVDQIGYDMKKLNKYTDVEVPQYHKIIAECACGARFEMGSTLPSIRVDICSNCHPFYTGKSRIIDTEGRVEKFKKKYNLN